MHASVHSESLFRSCDLTMPFGFLRNTHRRDGSGGYIMGSPIGSLFLVRCCCVEGIVVCWYGIVARCGGGNLGFAEGGNCSTI